MAVKRKSLAERKKMIGDAIKDINKAAGATIIGTLNDEDIAEKLVIEYIPTPSLRLNEATGGGIPRSKYTLVAGNPDSGKTMLMLETIAHNLETDPDFTGCWIESENSLESTSIKMFGITDEDLKDTSEIGAIYILKEYYGKGVGYKLISFALNKLKDTKQTSLWVIKNNVRAINFYKKVGFKFEGKEQVVEFGTPITEVRMIKGNCL